MNPETHRPYPNWPTFHLMTVQDERQRGEASAVTHNCASVPMQIIHRSEPDSSDPSDSSGGEFSSHSPSASSRCLPEAPIPPDQFDPRNYPPDYDTRGIGSKTAPGAQYAVSSDTIPKDIFPRDVEAEPSNASWSGQSNTQQHAQHHASMQPFQNQPSQSSSLSSVMSRIRNGRTLSDPPVHEQIKAHWDTITRTGRIIIVGSASVILCCVIAMIIGFTMISVHKPHDQKPGDTTTADWWRPMGRRVAFASILIMFVAGGTLLVALRRQFGEVMIGMMLVLVLGIYLNGNLEDLLG